LGFGGGVGVGVGRCGPDVGITRCAPTTSVCFFSVDADVGDGFGFGLDGGVGVGLGTTFDICCFLFNRSQSLPFAWHPNLTTPHHACKTVFFSSKTSASSLLEVWSYADRSRTNPPPSD
jgi:hypothetical protein